jgi:hypothetical protein
VYTCYRLDLHVYYHLQSSRESQLLSTTKLGETMKTSVMKSCEVWKNLTKPLKSHKVSWSLMKSYELSLKSLENLKAQKVLKSVVSPLETKQWNKILLPTRNNGLQDFEISKDFNNRDFKFSKDFQKTSKDFIRLHKASGDFKRFQRTSRDFIGVN